MDLTRLCNQVDVVVGSHGAKALGYASEFQLHRYFPFRICVVFTRGLQSNLAKLTAKTVSKRKIGGRFLGPQFVLNYFLVARLYVDLA